MTATETTDAGLSWDVLTIRRPGLTRDLPAGKEELMWVANSSTLIHGERDAVLVDTFLTTEQSQALLNWVVASKLVAMNAGRTDTAHSTCLHVPSIGLIVGGDAVYNGIHPFLGETDRQSRLEWISTLDKLEALNPIAVIAGHKIPENPDDPRIIGETRQYVRDFMALDEATTTARQLYDAMLELYPDRVNPGSLWGAANTAKKQT